MSSCALGIDDGAGHVDHACEAGGELVRQRLAVLTALSDPRRGVSELITLKAAINELCTSASRTPHVGK